MELETPKKRVDHSFRLVKFDGKRVKDMSDAMIKRLSLYNNQQTRLPCWDQSRINRIPTKVEEAVRKELKLRGYKVIGLRIENI